jgi:hypothetical protein
VKLELSFESDQKSPFAYHHADQAAEITLVDAALEA